MQPGSHDTDFELQLLPAPHADMHAAIVLYIWPTAGFVFDWQTAPTASETTPMSMPPSGFGCFTVQLL